jgi:hypothetical protein
VVRHAVPALLTLFGSDEICATWATVGALGCEGSDECFTRAPRAPNYRNMAFAVKPDYADLDTTRELHFAPDLLRQIVSASGQELASHTFSHLCLREEGIAADDSPPT